MLLRSRVYGLLSANPLGEKIFTKGKTEKKLTLKKGGSVTFRYRIIIDNGVRTISTLNVNKFADAFAATSSPAKK